MTSDRDRSIERLLRRARSSRADATNHCLDAETLAAFADDTLRAAARREAEAHLADCDRCQALTAAMVRADVSAGTHEGTARRHMLGWLVPAAAAATAIALWVLVPGRPPVPEQPVADREAAVAQPARPLETESAQQPASSTRVGPAQGSADARSSDEARRRDANAGSGSPPSASSETAALAQSLKAEEALNSAARADSAAPRQEPTSAPAARQGADQARANQSAKAAAPPPSALTVQSRVAAGFEIVSPNPRARWRVGPGPVVQHSTDGGASWTTQQTGVSTQLIAGSSPSPEVCWVVGRGGIVLRTNNGGGEWQRTPLPETADVIAITASTALDATVTLTDGRRLTTMDGGRTWAPVP